MKYNNSMYTTIPPKTVICEPITPQEFLEEQIADHILEEEYELNKTKIEQEIEQDYLKELTKNEPRNKCIC